MSMSKTIFRELLDKEASPALGCTEPMMFALAGAITRKHAPGKVLRVDMVGCGLMVTGVQAVGIPNTGGKNGAFLASAGMFLRLRTSIIGAKQLISANLVGQKRLLK